MPKRVADGDALWRSDKFNQIEPPSYRAEYANLQFNKRCFRFFNDHSLLAKAAAGLGGKVSRMRQGPQLMR